MGAGALFFAAGAAAVLGVAAGAGAGVAAGAAPAAEPDAAYQLWTPLCPRQAPFLVGPLQNDPSLHSPVVPVGALEGACAMAVVASSRPPISAANTAEVFIIMVPV